MSGLVTASSPRTATGSASRAWLIVPLLGLGGAVAALGADSPALAIAAAVGVAGLAAVLARPSYGILLLVATGPLESAVSSGAGLLTPVKVAGMVCVGAFAVDAFLRHRLISFDRVHAILSLLLAVALVSTLAARSTPDALSTTVRYASFAGLYFVATQRANDRRLPVAIVWVLSLAAAAAGALAVSNYLTGATNVASHPFGDPNDLAFNLATTLPLMVWLLGRARRSRPLLLGAIAVTAVAVVLSFSRGALLAIACGVAWHALTNRRHIPILLTAAVATAAAALFFVGSNEAKVESTLIQKQNISAFNVETRLDAWRAAVELATERPLLGVGPGNFGSYYFEKTGRPPGTFGLRVVHDAYLDVAAELGFTGVLLFLAYLGTVMHRATAAVRERRGPPALASAVRTGLVIAMVGALTLSEQYFPPFWVLGALATLVAQAGPEERRPRGHAVAASA